MIGILVVASAITLVPSAAADHCDDMGPADEEVCRASHLSFQMLALLLDAAFGALDIATTLLLGLITAVQNECRDQTAHCPI